MTRWDSAGYGALSAEVVQQSVNFLFWRIFLIINTAKKTQPARPLETTDFLHRNSWAIFGQRDVKQKLARQKTTIIRYHKIYTCRGKLESGVFLYSNLHADFLKVTLTTYSVAQIQ